MECYAAIIERWERWSVSYDDGAGSDEDKKNLPAIPFREVDGLVA